MDLVVYSRALTHRAISDVNQETRNPLLQKFSVCMLVAINFDEVSNFVSIHKLQIMCSRHFERHNTER